jgi:hypothetical protein
MTEAAQDILVALTSVVIGLAVLAGTVYVVMTLAGAVL